MLSLLSRTFVVSKVGIPGPTPFCWPTVWRLFSRSHVKCAAPKDPEARRKRLDKHNERARQKYHNDHDFRKKVLSNQLAKYHSDPVQREYTIQIMRLRERAWRAQNPRAYAERLERGGLTEAARYTNDPRYKFLKEFRGWLVRHACILEELPWKPHVPVFSEEKILRKCAGRDRLSHLADLKLWYVHAFYVLSVDAAILKGFATSYTENGRLTTSRWELRKDIPKEDADEYLCHPCYIPRENWQDALPRGYTDLKSMRKLVARKKKLGSGDHGSQSVNHIKGK